MPTFLCVFSLAVLAVSAKDSSHLVRKHIGADGTIADDSGASLTATIEQLKIGEKVQDLLHEFEDLASSGVAPDKGKIGVIKSIVTDELLPDLQATHDGAAKQVKSNLAGIAACNANALSRLQEVKTTTEVSVGQARAEHASCREAEKGKLKTKKDKCGDLDAFLNGINVPVDLPAGRPRDEMVKYVKTMSDYFCPKGPTVTTLDDDCTKATEEYRKHKAECDRLQAAFELAFCTWRQELTDACDALSTCYEDATKKYNDHVADTKELVKRWKVEYSSLKKILCYVDVWITYTDCKSGKCHNDIDAAKFETCKSSRIDASSMDVDFGTPAEKAQCPLTAVQNYPGTPGFRTTEYANFDEYVNEVIPCFETLTPMKPMREKKVYR